MDEIPLGCTQRLFFMFVRIATGYALQNRYTRFDIKREGMRCILQAIYMTVF